ncbi:MAG: DUF4363 family protein [Clostridia bacterium]|nr:DUF4363 family protein [Clostridia bacterium]
MNNDPMPHMRASRIATIVAILFLLLLFVLPSLQVHALADAILPYAQSATDRVVLGDWAGARRETSIMYQLYLPYDTSLRLYLDHEDVDTLRMRLLSCLHLAEVEDEQIIVDLEEAKNKLDYLKNIETFSLVNLF